MPRSNGHVPSYRLHKPSGQARVIISGRHVYLGPYGSPQSREKYARLIAELPSDDGVAPHASNGYANGSISINQLLLAYWEFAERYYVKDGKPTRELQAISDAIWPVRNLYGLTKASDFGPRALKVVRQFMIDDQDLSRKVINYRIGRIKRVFRWAVAEELVPPSAYHALQAVAGLRFGRTEARETEPVKPVDDKHVEAVLPYLTPHVAAMVQVQRLTGMRPDDVVNMRPCDIDKSADVWIYERQEHKNRWRGHRRLIPIGPKAQEVLKPFLNRDPEVFLFSPKESEAWRHEHRPAYSGKKRKTPIYPSELRAREKKKQARRRRKTKRAKRDHYDTASYRRAINYGFLKARKAGTEIPHWHPNQLRHTRGTEIRKEHGVEAAQVVLGHARADVTQVYAEKNLAKAIEIARESG